MITFPGTRNIFLVSRNLPPPPETTPTHNPASMFRARRAPQKMRGRPPGSQPPTKSLKLRIFATHHFQGGLSTTIGLITPRGLKLGKATPTQTHPQTTFLDMLARKLCGNISCDKNCISIPLWCQERGVGPPYLRMHTLQLHGCWDSVQKLIYKHTHI